MGILRYIHDRYCTCKAVLGGVLAQKARSTTHHTEGHIMERYKCMENITRICFMATDRKERKNGMPEVLVTKRTII